MNLIRLAIQQPVTITVGVIVLLLAGLLSLAHLPIALTPTIQDTIITVSTFWEGASPEEIEENIIDKQEERLMGLSDLVLMTSTSSQGQGRIRLQFATGVDTDVAMLEVSQKLDQVASYPENVDNPVIEESDMENRDYIAWIVFGTTDPDLDIRTLRDFATDRIEPLLERVPGVSEINVLGGRERELQVRVDPDRLASFGITPTQFARVIRATNQNVSAGQRADGRLDVRLRAVSQFASIDEIERTVIADTPGGPIRVSDVAAVELSFKEPTSFVRSKGQPVIAINADRELDSNVMAVMDGLRSEIARLNAPGGLLDSEAKRLGLNGTLALTQVYDQTVYIDDALALVRNNIWIGGGLATLVLILFLRSLRTAGIIAVAIPISVIGAVVAMVALGRSINVVSLAGMAFAVGMVVDNAIVVLENIFRHLEMGKRPFQAAYDGTHEVWGAVLASTLTTIVVFVPILLIQEESGQLFRDIALAICAAVGLSLIVSITVIPTAAARLLRSREPLRSSEPVDAIENPRGVSGRFSHLIYLACGSWTARIALILFLTVASVVGSVLLMPPADYLPTGNRNLVFGLVIPPPGLNLDHMSEMGARIEETVRPYWEAGNLRDDPDAYEAALASLPAVPTFDWMAGRPGLPVAPPSLENYFLVTFEGILFHGAVADDPKRVVDLLPLFSHVTRPEVLPGVIAFPLQVPLFQHGGSSGTAIKMQFSGPDLDEVSRCALMVFLDLNATGNYQSVVPSPGNFNIKGPEVQVRPNLVRLSELGLEPDDVSLLVRAMGDGAVIDEYHLAGETVDLKVIAESVVGATTLTGLEDVQLATPSGHVVPLSAIAGILRLSAPAEIARAGRQRAVTVEVTAQRGQPLETVIRDLEALIAAHRADGSIPPSVLVGMAGSASKLQEVRAALLGDGTVIGLIGSSLFLALFVVYLLMCVLFQSFLQPLVIMFSVPLATVGGFAALFGVFTWSKMDRYMPVQMLDVLTMLGFILLIGVVVNNAILIVHQTNNLLRGEADLDLRTASLMTPRRAIAEAVRTRLRPIFMSTLTSIGGMLPLVLMPGSGSELYRGLGSVVVGGLLVSTIFTLILVPLLLSVVFDVRSASRREGLKPNVESRRPEPSRASEPLGTGAG